MIINPGAVAKEIAEMALPAILDKIKGAGPVPAPAPPATKPAVKSETFWGALSAIAAGLTAAYVAWQAKSLEGVVAGLSAAFGGLFALVGRFKATTQLKLFG